MRIMSVTNISLLYGSSSSLLFFSLLFRHSLISIAGLRSRCTCRLNIARHLVIQFASTITEIRYIGIDDKISVRKKVRNKILSCFQCLTNIYGNTVFDFKIILLYEVVDIRLHLVYELRNGISTPHTLHYIDISP